MAMMVRMGVHDIPVRVSMHVDEIGSKQECLIHQDLGGRSGGDHGPRFQHENPVCNVLDNVQLLSGSNNGPRRSLPLLDEIDELTLASRVKRSGRFVQQEDFGIKN